MTLSLFYVRVPAPTDTYTLSLHDALPIAIGAGGPPGRDDDGGGSGESVPGVSRRPRARTDEGGGARCDDAGLPRERGTGPRGDERRRSRDRRPERHGDADRARRAFRTRP